MTQPLDIQALRNPSPDRQAFVETISEALDAALENDIQVLQATLWYARVHNNGTQERPERARQIDFPVDGSDPGKIADQIVASYVDRSPGDGFLGRVKITLQDGGGEEIATPLGSFERFVQIGDMNHQMGHDPHDPYGQQHLPPPGSPPFPPQFGGYGGGGPPPPSGYGGMSGGMPGGPMFPGGPMTFDEEMDQEKQGMMLAMSGANERRLDMVLRQNQFLMERMMDLNGHYLSTQGYVMQLASHYMNRYQPPPSPAGGGGGGEQNAMASIIGGLLSMMLGGGGGGAKETPPPREPMVPPTPMPGSMPPQPDSYVPYEPPEDLGGMGVDPGDITEDSANAWAQDNPAAAKRVARNLLPAAMQGLIPE